MVRRKLFCVGCGNPVVSVRHLNPKDGRFVCVACAKFVYGPHKMDSVYKVPSKKDDELDKELCEFSKTEEFAEAYRELVLEAEEISQWGRFFDCGIGWLVGSKRAYLKDPNIWKTNLRIDLTPFLKRD